MPYLGFEQCYLWVHDEVDDRSMKYDDKVRLNFSIFYTQKVHQVLLQSDLNASVSCLTHV